jgi:hypothetical protein
MTLYINHHPNPDIDGGYWVDRPEWDARTIDVGSYAEASEAFTRTVGEHNLGAGNCPGAWLRESEGFTRRWVSYNGRVWADQPIFGQPSPALLYDPR